MKQRTFHLAFFISTILLSIVLSISQVSAFNLIIPTPKILPITHPSPITRPAPITPPSPTLPISPPGPVLTNLISGQVAYKIFGLKIPAVNISVELTNSLYKWKLATSTDILGRYSFNPPNGIYSLRVYDQRNTLFTPFSRIVKLQNQKYYSLDFQGYPRFKL